MTGAVVDWAPVQVLCALAVAAVLTSAAVLAVTARATSWERRMIRLQRKMARRS